MVAWRCHLTLLYGISSENVTTFLEGTRNSEEAVSVLSAVQQTQQQSREQTFHQLKATFLGRDSILMALLVYLGSILISYSCLVSLMMGRDFGEWASRSHPGMIIYFSFITVVPTMIAGWVTAYIAPRWHLVARAAFNTAVFGLYIFPQLCVDALRGEGWQFCELMSVCLIALSLQIIVILIAHRCVLRKN